jgi:hypothetical protein
MARKVAFASRELLQRGGQKPAKKEMKNQRK